MGQVTSLPDPPCYAAFNGGVASILVEQGETTQVAAQLASGTADTLKRGDYGSRPFLIASPSGADYYFFVENKSDACVLRLYGRQKGFTSYTNNLTYIATRPLAPCQCTD
jgi:hypothetical protein